MGRLVAGSGRGDEETRARVRWSSVREPEHHTPYDRRSWSRVGRRGWGDAPGRPYERTEIPGTAGAIVYLILGAFVGLTVLVALWVAGFIG